MLIAESPGRRETMQEYFAEHALPLTPATGFAQFAETAEKLALAAGPLHSGFILADPPVAIVTENELYAQQARARSVSTCGAKAFPTRIFLRSTTGVTKVFRAFVAFIAG